MFDNASFNAFIDRQAEDFNRLKPYRDEMKAGFLVFSLLGLFANIVSMASAWQFFTRLLGVLIDSKTLIYSATALLLILLEMATIWLIHKTVKFIVHTRIITALTFFLFALAASIANFYTSTNGLKEKSLELISRKDEIRRQYSSDSLALEARIVPTIDSLVLANSRIAGTTTLQNTTIFAANSKMIADLREELKNERKAMYMRFEANLSKDEIKSTTRSDIYWLFVVGNQILLFISYVFCAFYYHKTDEQNKTTETKVQEFAIDMRDKAMVAIHEMANAAMGNYFAGVLHQTEREVNLQRPVQFEAIDTTTEEHTDTSKQGQTGGEHATKPQTKVIGFSMEKLDSKPVSKTSSPLGRPSGHSQNQSFQNQSQSQSQKQIEKLKRHATLVRHIVEISDDKTESITNETIRKIQDAASTAKSKSRSLIRELHMITVAIGHEKVEGVL